MSGQGASRRGVLKLLTLAAGAGVLALRRAGAEEAPKLSATDPAAIALGYVENASLVDAKKFPGYVPGSNCENCLQLQGTAGDNYRPCSVFNGKRVAVSGWCSAWAAEM